MNLDFWAGDAVVPDALGPYHKLYEPTALKGKGVTSPSSQMRSLKF